MRRSDCAAPGITRRARGRGFEYLDLDGNGVEDPKALERIADLAIPPAWRDVWICADQYGHLQATGVDAAGRKQYLYHARWRAHRDRRKFDSMLAFGSALPRLSRGVARDLGIDDGKRVRVAQLTEQRVLACAARLLDLGLFRIRSEDYAERNESYGLTTMLREHVTIGEREVVFDFPAKSGSGGCRRLPTLRCAARERDVKHAIKTVATYLGNTPAVCRASYVDPRVIDRFQAGVTIIGAIGKAGPDLGRPRVRARVERAVLELLEDDD